MILFVNISAAYLPLNLNFYNLLFNIYHLFPTQNLDPTIVYTLKIIIIFFLLNDIIYIFRLAQVHHPVKGLNR